MNTSQEIMNYITQKAHNGALLVTGKWGSGKSFLIRNIITEINQGKEYLGVCISLFGIDTIHELHKRVKEAVAVGMSFEQVPGTLKKMAGKVKAAVTPITEALSEYSEVAKGINTALSIRWQDFFSIEKTVKCYKDKEFIDKELVLFFDDFERCKIDRIDLMGAVNEYSEGKSIKIILIADEDHINKKEYKDFKEKLISRTIKLTSNYESAIEAILDSYEETMPGYQAFLKENNDVIKSVFYDSNTENLRSLKAFLADYERVYDVWHNSDVPTEAERDILYAFGAKTFAVKSGIYAKDEENGYIYSNTELHKQYPRLLGIPELTSLHNWIVDGIWDKDFFYNEINDKYNTAEMKPVQKFLNYSFWDLQQSIIEEGMPIAVDMAYNGELSQDQLIHLFDQIFILRDKGFPFPCDVDYSKIEKGLKKRIQMILEREIIEPKSYLSTTDLSTTEDNVEPEAQHLLSEIEKLPKKIAASNNYNSFSDYLNGENGVTSYSLNHKIINCFDSELLDLFSKTYFESDSSGKREMITTLQSLSFDDKEYSSHEEREETIKNFKLLQDRLSEDKENESDYVIKTMNTLFVSKLDEIIHQVECVDEGQSQTEE